jgi:3-oxoacyl-[acyl-carrier-protein] synthase III
MKAKIVGTGSYLPERVLTNDELSKKVDTSDEWIQQRVGISSRHIGGAHETTSYMAAEACKKALEAAKLEPSQIDLIIVATSTPDDLMPSTASKLMVSLGISGCPAFDISAACSGFVYALTIADQFFKTGAVRHALVVGADAMSRVVDWTDRRTCVLFGDGAGAVVLSQSDTEQGILSTHIHADGQFRDLLYVPNALQSYDGFAKDASENTFLSMEGSKVFKHAVSMLDEIVHEALKPHALSVEDIDWLIPHQANERIIVAAAHKLGMPMERVVVTLGTQGNTSAATVPLALDVAVKDGRIQPGHLLLLEAFGAGFVWGAVLVRY